jgi:hypothetical protein
MAIPWYEVEDGTAWLGANTAWKAWKASMFFCCDCRVDTLECRTDDKLELPPSALEDITKKTWGAKVVKTDYVIVKL